MESEEFSEALGARAEKWDGPTHDAQGRSWWPEWFLDEVMPPGRPSPKDWLDCLPSTEENVPIHFCWSRMLGSWTIRWDGEIMHGVPDTGAWPANVVVWLADVFEDVTPPEGETLAGHLAARAAEFDIQPGDSFDIDAIEWSTKSDAGQVWHLEKGQLVEHGSG